MNRNDLYWLAGLVEGEGSFMAPSPSAPNQPKISVSMTDKDVVKRVAKLFGTVVTPLRMARSHWRPAYLTRCTSRRAAGMMWMLYPLMGTRRKAQIRWAVRYYKPPALPIVTCTQQGCARKHRARGLCGSHYELRRRRGDFRGTGVNGSTPALQAGG